MVTSSASSFALAAFEFKKSCDVCTKIYDKPCAHYASDALARAGWDILEPHDAITPGGRCEGPKGKKRPIRSHDLKAWVEAHGWEGKVAKPPKGIAAFFFCMRDSDSQGHCGFIDILGAVRDSGTGENFGEKKKPALLLLRSLAASVNGVFDL